MTNIWALRVSLVGVAPRCRKVDRHSVNLIELPDTGEALELPDNVKTHALNVVSKYKKVTNAKIIAYPREHHDGMIRQRLLDPRTQEWNLIP